MKAPSDEARGGGIQDEILSGHIAEDDSSQNLGNLENPLPIPTMTIDHSEFTETTSGNINNPDVDSLGIPLVNS